MEFLSAASNEHVVTNRHRASRQAIQRVGKALRRTFAGATPTRGGSSIPVLGDSNRGLANEDEGFVGRCRRAAILGLTHAFNGGLTAEVTATLHVSGRFLFARGFVNGVSDDVRVPPTVTLRVGGRIFRSFLLRPNRHFLRLLVNDNNGAISAGVASLVFGRVKDVRTMGECFVPFRHGKRRFLRPSTGCFRVRF